MGLTFEQRRFLAARLLCASDAEAARKLGLDVDTPSTWKGRLPEFREAYEKLPNDGLEFAKETLRQMLADGVMVHADLLHDNKAEVRLGGVRLLYESNGLLVKKTELTGKDGAAVQVEQVGQAAELTDEELRVLRDVARRRIGTPSDS